MVPKYKQLAKKLRDEIIVALYLGERVVQLTPYEIARAFDLSEITVETIIRKHHKTNKENYEKYKQPISKHNYKRPGIGVLDNLRPDDINASDVVWDNSPEQSTIDTSKL